MDKLANKVIFITGASKGIGKALALHLAKSGARLGLLSRGQTQLNSLQAEIESLGQTAATFTADVTDFPRALQSIADCESQLGPIDILINNAGIIGPHGPVAEQDFEALWKTVEVNVRGPMAYMQAVLPSMLRRNTGTILNIGSYSSVHPFTAHPAYSASKAALARYTDSVCASLKDTGISLFTVSPGLVRTDMTDRAPFAKDIPPQSWNPVEDICSLVAKLASGSYSALNGRFIHVNDPLDALAQASDTVTANNLYSLTLNTLDGPLR